MGEKGAIGRKRQLLMTRKRGVIPRAIWNQLVEWVAQNQIISVVGGEKRVTSEGTVLEVTQRPDRRATSQFRIWQDTDTDKTLRVSEGVVRIPELHANNAGIAAWGLVAERVSAGSQVPAASTTYGVWLQCQYQTGSSTTPPRIDTNAADLNADSIVTGQISVVFSSSYTDASAIGTFLANVTPSSAGIFLGTVETDVDGNATSITQEMFGPITLPMPTYLVNIP